jgi:sigma-B regulation protein RsbU (phosphoserine phosphatase)
LKLVPPELSLAEVFSGLPDTELPVDTVLLRQGEASEFAYYLKSGSVAVLAETKFGTVTLAVREAPQLIGEIGVLAQLPRTASMKAITAINVVKITGPQLLAIGQQNPTLLLTVIAQLGRQIDAVNKTVGLYTTALAALEEREFDPAILEELANPPPQLAEFSSAFQRFARQISSKRRQQDELAGAAIIQKSFLPKKSAVKVAGERIDLHAAMRPARDVGGDFYDYFMLDNDRLAICIDDICGKGISASIFMSVVITTLRTAAREESDVAAIMARANAILSRDNAACMFATVFFAVVELKSGKIAYCNCGHNSPYLVDEHGQVTPLPATGLPMGLYGEIEPGAGEAEIQQGGMLVLFTDGVTEAMNSNDEEFGDEALGVVLAGKQTLTSAQVVSDIFAAVDLFADGAEQADDITLLALKRSAQNSA